MAGIDLERAADTARRAALAARAVTRAGFRRTQVETKPDGSPVTAADREAERAIRAVLREADPDFAILGEELGEDLPRGASDWREVPAWLVDPIDGTISYSRGIPLFTTVVALAVGGEPALGLIDVPMLDELYLAWRGGGCRRNGETVRVSTENDLARALVSHGDPMAFEAAGTRAGLE